MNDFYTATGNPNTNAAGSSAVQRAENLLIQMAFDKFPGLTGNALKLLRVNAGETALDTISTGDFTGSSIAFSSIITPTQIVANTNNYAPTGLSTAAVLRLSTDAVRNITGITGGAAGRMLLIFNVGLFPICFKNNVTSTAANRFLLGQDFYLKPVRACLIQYDPTSVRWRLVGELPVISDVTKFGAADAGGTTVNDAAFTLAEADAAPTHYVPEGTFAITLALTKTYTGPGNIVQNGVSIGPADGVVRNASGPIQTFFNNVAGPSYVEFLHIGSSIRGATGLIGGIEWVDSCNMDYRTGVHRLYDQGSGANWHPIGTTGEGLQYAPATMAAGDVWDAGGNLLNWWTESLHGGRFIFRGMNVLQRETMTVANGVNNNRDCPSTGVAFTTGATLAFAITGIVAPTAPTSMGTAYTTPAPWFILFNNTPGNMALSHNSGLSTAGNRIFCPNDQTLTLYGTNACCILMYDYSLAGWVVVAVNQPDDYLVAASTACTGAIVTSCAWRLHRHGNRVTLTLPAVQGNGVATSKFSVGATIPAAYRPPSTQCSLSAPLINNAANRAGPGAIFVTTAGVIEVYLDGTFSGNFTVTANAGLANETSISWVL